MIKKNFMTKVNPGELSLLLELEPHSKIDEFEAMLPNKSRWTQRLVGTGVVTTEESRAAKMRHRNKKGWLRSSSFFRIQRPLHASSTPFTAAFFNT